MSFPTWTALGPWGNLLLVAAALVAATQVAHWVLRPVLARMAGWSGMLLAILRRCDRPARFLMPLVALQVLWQGAPEALPGIATVEQWNGVLLIVATTFLCTAAIQGVADGVSARFPADLSDNLEARRIQTQTGVLARTAKGVALITGMAFVLMTFPRARQLGASLLASAGVVGLIAGIAARSVFSNLLAGLQIALAQPIRIDDVLIVEGEWGRVEEITATYVVLKLWDERRLIVPLAWFIEHPFQNWTRTSAELLGSVFLWVDHRTPVEPLRAEAQRLCEASPHWDRKVCVVQVTDTNERAMQLRILVSAASSGPNFDLRCELREGLIAFLARTAPEYLPRARVELEETGTTSSPRMATAAAAVAQAGPAT